MQFLDDSELERALKRFFGLTSVFGRERVCLPEGIPLSDLQGHAGVTLHSATWRVPRLLRPLADLCSADTMARNRVTCPTG